MLEELKKFIGDKLFTLVMLVAMGFSLAVFLPQVVVTRDYFEGEKDRIERKIDTNVAKLSADIANLELVALKKEKNELLDLIEAGKAKQRHKDQLDEVKTRIKELEDNKKAYQKIMEPK